MNEKLSILKKEFEKIKNEEINFMKNSKKNIQQVHNNMQEIFEKIEE